MNQFLQNIANFALGTSIWVYVFIFFGKILEVSFGTLRIVLINRGVRTVGMFIAFVEISLWLVVASSVLAGFREDFWKGVVYALAFAIGNYLGSWLDELLAFGLSSLQVVIGDAEEAVRVEEALRTRGFGITSMDVHGRDCDHYMLMLTIKRKYLSEILRWLETNCASAVVTVGDVKTMRGGYTKSVARTSRLRIGK